MRLLVCGGIIYTILMMAVVLHLGARADRMKYDALACNNDRHLLEIIKEVE